MSTNVTALIYHLEPTHHPVQNERGYRLRGVCDGLGWWWYEMMPAMLSDKLIEYGGAFRLPIVSLV